MQLRFNFEGKSDVEFLLDELALTNNRLDNIRRGLFARFTKLEKEVQNLNKEKERENKVVDMPIIAFLESKQA